MDSEKRETESAKDGGRRDRRLRRERKWSTHSDSGADALSDWSKFLKDAAEVDLCSAVQAEFFAEVRDWRLASLSLSIIKVGEETIKRSRQKIARSRRSLYEVIYFRRGRAYVSHYGRSFALSEGECVIIDTKEPYELWNSAKSEQVIVHIPQGWLKTFVVSPEDGVGKPVNYTMRGGRFLIASLNVAAHICERRVEADDLLLIDQIGRALAIAIGPLHHDQSTYSRKFQLRVQETLRDLHSDSDLNAERVAAIHGVSVRYLHSIFATGRTTFGKELMRIRLESAVELLASGTSERPSIIDVALRCGFSNASHFARRFRKHFGLNPQEFRDNHEASPHQAIGRSSTF